MMLHEKIFSLISTIASGKVFPGYIPQGTSAPFISHIALSRIPEKIMNGKHSLEKVNYQITIFHNSKQEAETMGNQVQLTLDHYSGTDTGLNIEKIRFQHEEPDYDPDTNMHLVIQEYLIRLK